MRGQISPQFKEALRQELKRQIEARPVFGQGGAAGAGIRRLDQQLKQLDSQLTRMDSAIPELGRKYDAIKSQAFPRTPEEKAESRRIRKIVAALEEAETHLGQLREALHTALNARG